MKVTLCSNFKDIHIRYFLIQQSPKKNDHGKMTGCIKLILNSSWFAIHPVHPYLCNPETTPFPTSINYYGKTSTESSMKKSSLQDKAAQKLEKEVFFHYSVSTDFNQVNASKLLSVPWRQPHYCPLVLFLQLNGSFVFLGRIWVHDLAGENCFQSLVDLHFFAEHTP